jgi:hypothetical protein
VEDRARQLILPFGPALPDRSLILAPRLWPTMTPRAQRQLAQRMAQLLRSVLTAADAGELCGGSRDEHAAQFGKFGNDVTPRQAGRNHPDIAYPHGGGGGQVGAEGPKLWRRHGVFGAQAEACAPVLASTASCRAKSSARSR